MENLATAEHAVEAAVSYFDRKLRMVPRHGWMVDREEVTNQGWVVALEAMRASRYDQAKMAGYLYWAARQGISRLVDDQGSPVHCRARTRPSFTRVQPDDEALPGTDETPESLLLAREAERRLERWREDVQLVIRDIVDSFATKGERRIASALCGAVGQYGSCREIARRQKVSPIKVYRVMARMKRRIAVDQRIQNLHAEAMELRQHLKGE